MAQVAYGNRERIGKAIGEGKIPQGTIVVTNDEVSEMFFYASDGSLRPIAERNRFGTISEALDWVKTYPCEGRIVSVHNGTDWLPYIVKEGGKIIPITSGDGSTALVVERIDGGTSEGWIN